MLVTQQFGDRGSWGQAVPGCMETFLFRSTTRIGSNTSVWWCPCLESILFRHRKVQFFTVSAASFVCIQKLWRREIFGTKFRFEVLMCHEWRNGMADSSRRMGVKEDCCGAATANTQLGFLTSAVVEGSWGHPHTPSLGSSSCSFHSDCVRAENHVLEKYFYLKMLKVKDSRWEWCTTNTKQIQHFNFFLNMVKQEINLTHPLLRTEGFYHR